MKKFLFVSMLGIFAFLGCKKEIEPETKENKIEEVLEKEEIKTQEIIIDIPSSVNETIVQDWVVSNAYGEHKLQAPPQTFGKLSHSELRSTNQSLPSKSISYTSTFNYVGNGLILNSVLDLNRDPLMMTITEVSKRNKIVISAEETAIALLMIRPELITSNKSEYYSLVETIKSIPEFQEYKDKIADEMEKAMKRGIAPNYEKIQQGGIMRALLEKTFDNAELTLNGVTINRASVKRNNGKFEFTVQNDLKRILHMYPKKVYMQENGLNIKSEEYITYKFGDMVTPLPEIHILNSEATNYFKIVEDSFNGDKSSIYKTTSDVINVDIGDADKLHYEVYGIGRLKKPFSQHTKDEQFRIVLVGIHGAYNDFLKPILDLALGIENVVESSGIDDYKYDYRYGARKYPVQALINKLTTSFSSNPDEMRKFGKNIDLLLEGEILTGIKKIGQQLTIFCIDEIFENRNNEDKRTYSNLLYNIFKKHTKISKTPDAFREQLKSITNQITHIKKANFAGKVIEVTELALDLGGAIYAALTTDAKTDFWFDREKDASITIKKPTSNETVNPKSLRVEWELFRAGKTAEVRYEVIIKATQTDGQIKEKTFTNITDNTIVLDLFTELQTDNISSIRCKVIAKHAKNDSWIIAESDEKSYIVGAGTFNIPEGVIIENNILKRWPCDKIPSDGKVVIPNGVVKIENGVFRGCNKVTSIILPNTINVIGAYAFSGTKITIIKLPQNIRIIEEGTFENCSDLVFVTLPPSLVTISNNAFKNCANLKTINLPQGVVNIGRNAFERCSNLSTIIIPSSVATIQTEAFKSSGLTTITLPNNVSALGQGAFDGCLSLSTVILPNNIQNISDRLFKGCRSLFSITIPNKVTHIGNESFRECSSLTSMTIPSSVTHIGNEAFKDCISLVSTNLPNSINQIGDSAFESCVSLVSVTIPNRVTRIENGTFRRCSSLSSITIPDNITEIGSEAFLDCIGLNSITIGKGIKSIGGTAFLATGKGTSYGVIYTKMVNHPNSPPIIIKSTTPPKLDIYRHRGYDPNMTPFGEGHSPINIHVPKESVDAYKKHPDWQLISGRIKAIGS